MKVTKEQAAKNRAKILETASRLYRERGFDGVGVADIMRHAGFTHGGFYGHFRSREDLIAQASQRALAVGLKTWNQVAKEAKGDPLAAVLAIYLSDWHRKERGLGCLFAALGTDTARQPRSVRSVATKGFREVIEFLTELMPGKAKVIRRKKALATYASLIGGVAMARAVNDPELAEEITKAVSAAIMKHVASDK
jgi:TetR/AcrR family transcriptional repressor of nem operon